MNSTISLLLVVICTVVLAAQQSQAKKGCQAYGHVCYGGHGKRSLNSGTGAGAGESAAEQEYVRPNGLLPMLAPNEQAQALPEGDFDDYPARQALYKIMKSWFNRPRRPAARLGELDYPLTNSGELFNRDAPLNALN
ncbi:neuropeptide CCHamide-2 [Drosophila obscura]|uniref:neuropeptide CCHamide-2 n=1 Tax=Drosophila obscura TaxID=7282 RepID=UPI000BA0E5C4|nr:neuropeptide CCHamide-2 [Drosophila obscura]XP_022221953.1 neuropeptide CCHamide-2 [Drosophila obscura]XP_022221954.1 neuropeptide CCHamide-2 [Drosophila obscura]XP_022221955.1 neuropeptide CCHamide-2 [Drosophila obscura]